MDLQHQNKRLIDYARRGDLAQVNALLDKGADPDVVDHNNQTPLYYAVLHGKKEIVEALLKKGANPNFPYRGTLIKLAVDNERIEIIKLLIQYKADTKQKNIPIVTVSGRSFEHTLLHWAAAFEYVDIIKALKGTDVNHERNNGVLGSSPLEKAAERGKLHVVNALLAIGANPNQKSKLKTFGTSPLIAAIKKGHIKVAERLLEYGADPGMAINVGTYDAADPVIEAQRFPEIARLLRTFDPEANKARNHLYYILDKGHVLDDLPYTLQEPYPDLLKALVLYTVEQGRLSVLSVILKQYKKEKLTCLNDSDVMKKIFDLLNSEESALNLKLSVIDQLKLLNQDNLDELKRVEEKIRSVKKQSEINPIYADLFQAINQDEYVKVDKILADNPALNLNNFIKINSDVTLLDFTYSRMLSYHHSNIENKEKTSDEKERENKKIFFALLARSDVNARSINGQSLLHIAVTGKAPLYHLVLLLLKGANPHLRDDKDKKPIDYLIDKNGNLKDNEMALHTTLLEKGIDYLLQPDQKALLDIVLEQLKAEDPLSFDYLNNLFIQYTNREDRNGNTWFHRHLISHDGHSLLESPWINHIDPNIKNNQGQTVLDIAIQKGDFALVNFLIEKGAIVDENTFSSTSCLKHFNYLYAQCGAFEKIPQIIKKPYPMLLRVMLDMALQNGRIDVLNAIAENYAIEQLSVLKEIAVIEKINASLEKMKITAPRHYRENWSIIKKLKELNSSNKKYLESSKTTHPTQSKDSKFSLNKMFLFFSKIRSPFSSREKDASVNHKAGRK